MKHKISSSDGRLVRIIEDLKDFDKHCNERMDIIKGLADLLEAIVIAVWVDSQDLVITRGVIKKLLGPLIVDHKAFAFRPVHQLWGTGLGKKRTKRGV